MRRLIIFMVIVLTLSACASSPPRARRSEFEDIPVPKGLELDWSRSTIIESPTIKAARSSTRAASLRIASPSRSRFITILGDGRYKVHWLTGSNYQDRVTTVTAEAIRRKI